VTGYQQAHVHQGMLKLVALEFVLAERLKLINKVKKDKKRKKSKRHKTNGSDNFAMDQTTNCFHASNSFACLGVISNKWRQDKFKCLTLSQAMANKNTDPCKLIIKTGRVVLPAAIQF
jgi:hypothetical protein